MRSYTALLAYMRTSVPVWCRLVAILFGCTFASTAQQPENPWPAERFVTQILSKAGTPASISLRFENKSTLDAASFKSIRRAIENDVRRRNLRIVVPESAIADCKITISENVQSLLWIGEIKEGLSSSYVMLSVPRPASASQRPHTLALRDSLTWSQQEPILDFVKIDPGILAVLTPSQIIYMMREAHSWRETKRQSLRYDRELPRDLRGKITLVVSAVEVFLPGVHCRAQTSDQELQCAEADDPWPLDSAGTIRAFYSANRNFFTGALIGGQGNVPAFYSAARTSNGGQPVWIMTGTNGTARMYADFTRPLATFADWGSDLASLRSNCGGDELIVSRPGDRSGNDAVQAVEISDGEASPSTIALEFPGPVMSLSSGPDFAYAIVFNSLTHQYETHVLTITCE
jgi:hypothetical protein